MAYAAHLCASWLVISAVTILIMNITNVARMIIYVLRATVGVLHDIYLIAELAMIEDEVFD